ncbi:GGDEF domain-containing protein [Shewanella sp. JL219SE-S6]
MAETESHNHKLLIAALFCVITLLLTWGYQSWKTQKRLRELAEFDCLTGIFSRGHFTQVGLSALEYCKLQQLPVSCIMLDLDNFKRINDTKGHKTGDWALREVARIARNLCNGKEILGRIGGEEFCLLMPETRIDKAIAFAEILRELLEQADTSDSGHSFTLTASFGVSEAAISGYQLETLLADTDKAMYQAKKNGRNQVCSAADIP